LNYDKTFNKTRIYHELYSLKNCISIIPSGKKNFKPTKKDIQDFFKKNPIGILFEYNDSFGLVRQVESYDILIEDSKNDKHGIGLDVLDPEYQKLFQTPHDFSIDLYCVEDRLCYNQSLQLTHLKLNQEIIFKSLISKFPNTKFFGKTKTPIFCRYPNLNMDCWDTTGLHWTNYEMINKSYSGYYSYNNYEEIKTSSFRWDNVDFDKDFDSGIIYSTSQAYLDRLEEERKEREEILLQQQILANDKQPPTAPQITYARQNYSWSSTDSMDIQFQQSEDNRYVQEYVIYLDNKVYDILTLDNETKRYSFSSRDKSLKVVQLGQGGDLYGLKVSDFTYPYTSSLKDFSIKLNDLEPNKNYELKITARDPSYNESSPSNVVSFLSK
jgi:hypothetical protein